MQPTVVKSSRKRCVLIAVRSLPLQVTDRYSVQMTAAIKQDRIRKRQTEKLNEEITITVSGNVQFVASCIGLHTVNKRSALKNAVKKIIM